jgi:hypothetical protein
MSLGILKTEERGFPDSAVTLQARFDPRTFGSRISAAAGTPPMKRDSFQRTGDAATGFCEIRAWQHASG